MLRAYINDNAKEKLKYIKENIRLIFNNFINNIKKLFNVIYKLKVVLSKF
jgi:vacuolar-type H+-ATPase subunit E/Vma4